MSTSVSDLSLFSNSKVSYQSDMLATHVDDTIGPGSEYFIGESKLIERTFD